jgi:hypothetical protein
MTLRKILGAILSVIGFLLSALGVISLIGPHGIGARLAAGGVMCTGGLAALVFGMILFRRVYRFEDVQAKLVLKKCPYCGNDYPVRDDIERCPTCGSDLKLQRTALAKGEDKFSMDDEGGSGVS